jgi:DNA repair photolyase
MLEIVSGTVTAFLYCGMAGRGFWLTAIMAPRFLASAFSSGPAFLIILCFVIRKVSIFDPGKEGEQVMRINTSNNQSILKPCDLENFNYQIDPYIGCEHYCHYCYVLNQAKTDWKNEIIVHDDVVERLESELSGIAPQTIYMGWHSDPYQPCEERHQQTRQVLELLQRMGFSASILTKSDLVVRDMAVLQSMKNASVGVSVAFNDEEIRSKFEDSTKETKARISALYQLKARGISTTALVCPVIPYITDAKILIDLLAGCADKIWVYGLSILKKSDQNWQNVERILEYHLPDLKKQIETVIFTKDHPYWKNLRHELLKIKKDKQLNLSVHV